jgi:hypothetical protein
VADARRSCPSRADRDVADLPVGWQISQQNEIPDVALKRLLVKFRAEHLHIELRAHGCIGNDDVQMFKSEILQRQCRARGRLRSSGNGRREQSAAYAGNK